MGRRMRDDVTAEATARQRDASDPATSVWVAASAGSGKTTVLTDRVLALLLTDTRPERILSPLHGQRPPRWRSASTAGSCCG